MPHVPLFFPFFLLWRKAETLSTKTQYKNNVFPLVRLSQLGQGNILNWHLIWRLEISWQMNNFISKEKNSNYLHQKEKELNHGTGLFVSGFQHYLRIYWIRISVGVWISPSSPTHHSILASDILRLTWICFGLFPCVRQDGHWQHLR